MTLTPRMRLGPYEIQAGEATGAITPIQNR